MFLWCWFQLVQYQADYHRQALQELEQILPAMLEEASMYHDPLLADFFFNIYLLSIHKSLHTEGSWNSFLWKMRTP